VIRTRPEGSALVVGLMLLALISLLGLAGASAAHVELQLARNEQFRENAASAASAGIESAISRIVSSAPDFNDFEIRASLPHTASRFEAEARFLGYELGLPQPPDANLAGAHLEITATGHAPRGGVDRQRAFVMLVVASPLPARATGCEPEAAGIPCLQPGALRRLSWQRLSGGS
jgi:hypothetical protein